MVVCALLPLLLWVLRAGPALGRELPRPPDDSEPYLTAGVRPRGLEGPQSQASDFWEKARDGDSWNSAVSSVPAGEPPLGPALHGPRAASRPPRVGPAVTDDLQMARGSTSLGWTGPLDSQESKEHEVPGPHPGGPPQLTVIPTTVRIQFGGATAPPLLGASAGLPPPSEQGVSVGAKTSAPETSPWDGHNPLHTPSTPLDTAGSPVLESWGGEEDFQEVARGPPLIQQGHAPPDQQGSETPVEGGSSPEPETQPDLAKAGSHSPAQETPVEPPRKDEGREESSPSPSPKQTDPPDVRGTPATESSQAPGKSQRAEPGSISGHCMLGSGGGCPSF